MPALEFNTTAEETRKILKISRKVNELYPETFNAFKTSMDLEVLHSNGCTLDLDGLLNARDFDLVHDITGIACHLDRETGQLKDCFVPRYARKQ